ncbi:hypothetical protein GE09DRAFT_1294196 [Coniochaeta sp. 2T2.1]|nr:hypothetical protein GE09DRAFT_1294196 [Coniochaeta sp. 2T2.1]
MGDNQQEGERRTGFQSSQEYFNSFNIARRQPRSSGPMVGGSEASQNGRQAAGTHGGPYGVGAQEQSTSTLPHSSGAQNQPSRFPGSADMGCISSTQAAAGLSGPSASAPQAQHNVVTADTKEATGATGGRENSICFDCDKDFTNAADLKIHRLVMHGRKQTWVCNFPGCTSSRVFDHQHSYIRHMIGVHDVTVRWVDVWEVDGREYVPPRSKYPGLPEYGADRRGSNATAQGQDLSAGEGYGMSIEVEDDETSAVPDDPAALKREILRMRQELDAHRLYRQTINRHDSQLIAKLEQLKTKNHSIDPVFGTSESVMGSSVTMDTPAVDEPAPKRRCGDSRKNPASDDPPRNNSAPDAPPRNDHANNDPPRGSPAWNSPVSFDYPRNDTPQGNVAHSYHGHTSQTPDHLLTDRFNSAEDTRVTRSGHRYSSQQL